MVMRNRNDTPGARRWWDDLPRVGGRAALPPEPEAEPRALVTVGELARDLTRLALLFFAVAVANTLFLLVALSFVAGR